MSDDPISLFDAWFAEAKASEPNDPEAMALATIDEFGNPNVRMVLLKSHAPDGFTFFTNRESQKGEELTVNPTASLLFHWKSLRRQVRIGGPVAPVSDAEADAYFATRGRDSQIGAWASDQSRPLDSRDHFLARFEEAKDRFADGIVPRPPYWTGFRVEPWTMEFWEDRPHRLHHRRFFIAQTSGGYKDWLLYP